jgi:hypothetical protein
MSNMLSAAEEMAAVELLHEMQCTDGLPVIVPTPERVERMVLASGLDPDISIGEMGPRFGNATVEKIAISCVMAGCLTDHMPVVIAALRAMCQPEFDLAEMQGTTHCTAPLVIVNGPARSACGGVASGFGALGPGHRANACIGRAIRLAMINIGGAWPGISDMALLGHPGKFTYCLAEDEESSPFPPLHTAWGYSPEQSAVTVLGAEAPHQVIFSGDVEDPSCAEALLRAVAAVIANTGSNNVNLGGNGAVAVIFNPDHAQLLGHHDIDRETVQRRLAEWAVVPVERLTELNPKMIRGKGNDGMMPAVRDPKKIVVLVAGGTGLYTAVMPSWSAGPHRNLAVHAEIELDQFCEVPG